MSLVEILVSVLIFSFGMLGLVGLQARAVQLSVSAEDTGRASLLASELAAAMWAARTVNLPSADVDAWKARVANATADGLPNGVGDVTVNGTVAEVSIIWRSTNKVDAAENTNRYTTQVMVR